MWSIDVVDRHGRQKIKQKKDGDLYHSWLLYIKCLEAKIRQFFYHYRQVSTTQIPQYGDLAIFVVTDRQKVDRQQTDSQTEKTDHFTHCACAQDN